jgi:hypothetical protein
MEKKNRFVSIFTLIMAVVLTTASMGCSSSDKDDKDTKVENKYLPTTFSVAIPKSLQKATSSSDLKGSARSLTGRTLSTGYSIMTDDIDDAAYMLGWTAIYFVVSDEIISVNGFTPQAASHGTVQLTVTQDLIDRVAAITGDMNVSGVDMRDYLNKQVPFDNFTYATTTTSPYNFLLSFTFTPPSGEAQNVKIQWSSDLKKVRYGVIVPNGAPEDGYSYLDNEFTYDDDLRGVAFVIYQNMNDGDTVDSLLKLRANDAGGAYVSDNLRDPPKSITNIQSLLAFANESGGILKDRDGTYTFDAKGAASTSTAYNGMLDEATAKLAEIPDLAAVTK